MRRALRCRPGDLALIVRSVRGVNVGKVIEVVRADPVWWGEWVCRSSEPLLGGVQRGPGDSPVVRTRFTREAIMPDSWLLPLRPDEVDEVEREVDRLLGDDLWHGVRRRHAVTDVG